MPSPAANSQVADDTRLWTPSRVDAVAHAKPDPLAQLLAEQRRERALPRLLISAAAALAILGLATLLL